MYRARTCMPYRSLQMVPWAFPFQVVHSCRKVHMLILASIVTPIQVLIRIVVVEARHLIGRLVLVEKGCSAAEPTKSRSSWLEGGILSILRSQPHPAWLVTRGRRHSIVGMLAIEHVRGILIHRVAVIRQCYIAAPVARVTSIAISHRIAACLFLAAWI